MKKNDDFILIPRKQAAQFIKNYCIANYSVLMFSYMATEKKLEIHMDTDEICTLLDITRKKLEYHCRLGNIKHFTLGGIKFYNAFDMAKIAEIIHRPKRFRQLAQMPSVPGNDKQPQ